MRRTTDPGAGTTCAGHGGARVHLPGAAARRALATVPRETRLLVIKGLGLGTLLKAAAARREEPVGRLEEVALGHVRRQLRHVRLLDHAVLRVIRQLAHLLGADGLGETGGFALDHVAGRFGSDIARGEARPAGSEDDVEVAAGAPTRQRGGDLGAVVRHHFEEGCVPTAGADEIRQGGSAQVGAFAA